MKLFDCRCAEKWTPLAPLVLRIVVGLIFFMHGYQKMTQFGVPGVTESFSSFGIAAPGFFAVLIIALELIGGLALVVGLLTHWVAKLFAIEMLVAIVLVHLANGFFSSSGGYEFPLLLLGASLSLMISGAGVWSLDHKIFHRNANQTNIQTS